ncbi:hypothetical protein [Pseudonocardia sp.]|uniref:hypothetical protein n=1 Tax=Pseudonocardia sp. TaxID=60912 RepID=UPI003D0F6ADB
MVPDTFGTVTLQVVAERAAALVPGFRTFLLACSLPGYSAARATGSRRSSTASTAGVGTEDLR